LHRAMALDAGRRKPAIDSWRGVGRWLATLHWKAGPARPSTTRPGELAAYTTERLQKWAVADPSCAPLAAEAAEAANVAVSQSAGRGVETTLCHGDVTAGNIMVSASSVGLIDFDDLRFDLPALDLSQGLLEIEEFSHFASVLRLRRFADKASRAFEEGYGRPFPEGPEYWIPHLRNLSIFLLTLATRSTASRMSAVLNAPRYRRTRAELARTVSAIKQSS
jgi:Ser/Thr protein kinase RdoA (MazF antagonist)